MPADKRETVKWFILAAKVEDANALYNLPSVKQGEGVDVDLSEALNGTSNRQRAASIDAQNSLVGATVSAKVWLSKCMKLLKRYTRAGSMNAQSGLVICYL